MHSSDKVVYQSKPYKIYYVNFFKLISIVLSIILYELIKRSISPELQVKRYYILGHELNSFIIINSNIFVALLDLFFIFHEAQNVGCGSIMIRKFK